VSVRSFQRPAGEHHGAAQQILAPFELENAPRPRLDRDDVATIRIDR
jgi:hypothetical protein